MKFKNSNLTLAFVKNKVKFQSNPKNHDLPNSSFLPSLVSFLIFMLAFLTSLQSASALGNFQDEP